MNRAIKLLMACNFATLLVAITACYFAYEARKNAREATFAAEWSSSGSARELSDIKDSVEALSKDLEYLTDRAKIEDRIYVPILPQR